MITPGGICVPESRDDEEYADFIARQPSADEMALMDAAREGQRCGEMGFGASMNPWQDSTPLYAAWESARLAAVAHRLSISVRLARCVC